MSVCSGNTAQLDHCNTLHHPATRRKCVLFTTPELPLQQSPKLQRQRCTAPWTDDMNHRRPLPSSGSQVCCSVCQRVAVYLSVLQCASTYSPCRRRFIACCGAVQCVAAYRCVFQCVAVSFSAWNGNGRVNMWIYVTHTLNGKQLLADPAVTVVSKKNYVMYNMLYFQKTQQWALCSCMHGSTGWRRLIGSPKLQIIFHKRAPKYRSLLRKMTCKDKGSYESSPPCITLHTFCGNMTCRKCRGYFVCCVIHP